MTLTLRAVSLNEQPLTQPITAHFDAQGGKVGRADTNTLALPDPERHISRQQAEIRAVGAGYTISNIGSGNPIVVRGQPLARGETTALSHRDQVRIGGYLLEVATDDGDEEASTITGRRASIEASVSPRTAPAARAVSAPIRSGGPFDDLLGPDATPVPPHAMPTPAPIAAPAPPAAAPRAAPAPADDPFADLFPAPAGIPDVSPAWQAPAPAPKALLPDDFDVFAPRPAPAEPPPRSEDPFDGLIPKDESLSIDKAFDLGAGDSDALNRFVSEPPPQPSAVRGEPPALAGVSTDPMDALFPEMKDARPAPSLAPTARDDLPDLQTPYKPPEIDQRIPTMFDLGSGAASHAPPPAPTPRPTPAPAARIVTPVPAPPPPAVPVPPVAAVPPSAKAAAEAPPANTADTATLWAAFCEGAGVRVDLPQGLNPDMMRIVGSLLRSAVDGTLRLVAVRNAERQALRAQVTVIQARNNNPLKFSPGAQVALEQMLKPPVRGFLPGPEAMTEAMHDLLGHSIGTMAGMRAALDGVLARFAPGELEAKLAGKSMLDSVLPMNRKARLWDLYLQKFEAIREEAQEDFDTLFGKAFVAAYEQQLEKLARERAASPRAGDA